MASIAPAFLTDRLKNTCVSPCWSHAAQDLVGQFVVGLDLASGIPTSFKIEAWLIT